VARDVVTFRVEGLSESLDALRDLRDNLGVSNATAKNTLKRALIYAAEPIEQAAAAAAPVRSGRLKTSIGTGTKLSRRQRAEHTKQPGVEIFVGAGPNPQAHLQEFGTAHHAPQPFMRPAIDANIDNAIKRFSDQVKLEVEKTAERARRKLARLLAKSEGN
jgi:HK97 gp10 family phage protein